MDERRLGRRDLAPTAGLFLLTFLSRLPFRSHILYHWDSVNLANGMTRLDVLNEHPQPPGYIVYVWLSRLANAVVGDANATMVWISVVAGAGSVALLYLMAADLGDRRQGIVAAAMLAASPLFWFYGEIALPHALDALLVIAAAWLLARVRRGQVGSAYPAVALLAVAGGVRQQTLVFLLPVALYAMWPLGRRWVLGAALAGGVLCLGWLLPLLASTGGLAPYLEKTSAYLQRFEAETSLFRGAGWPGLTRNVRKLALYTGYALLPALVALALLPAVARRRAATRRGGHPAGGWLFLALWAAPALLYYAVIHMGQQGLVFVYLPALILGAAWIVVRSLGEHPRALAAATLAALAGVAVFVAVPEYPLGSGTQRFLTRHAIANWDHYFAERLDAVRVHVTADGAAIVGTNWAHLEYYLPEYALLRVDRDDDGTLHPRDWPGPTKPAAEDAQPAVTGRDEVTLVFVDPETFPLIATDAPIRSVELPTSGELVLQVVPIDHLIPPPLPATAIGGRP